MFHKSPSQKYGRWETEAVVAAASARFEYKYGEYLFRSYEFNKTLNHIDYIVYCRCEVWVQTLNERNMTESAI